MSDETAAVPGSPASPATVLLGLPLGVSRQRRWTILLRLLLLFPLFVVELWYGLVGFALVIAAWFCAVFTRRVPDRIQETLTGILRWTARVYAYTFLLTDRWPGAHLAFREGDSADVKVDHVELRRSAVFFRAILAVPVLVVQSVLTQGVWPFALCMWIVGLFRGRCPKTLHQALALVLRFSTRASAYVWLMTPTMPFARMFGDAVEGTYVAPPADAEAEELSGVTTEGAQAVTAVPLEGAADDDRETLPATWVVRRRVKYVIVWMIIIGALTE
ncbi:MAG TPA: DUF4389 domain-containing protein, partial [Acidimicrobiales bacterium]|nr:DUF4389 domain-containing protein [Acidimicrobiales bacterium]